MPAKAPKTITSLQDVRRDPQNANRHTEAGRAVHEVSMRQYGAGRSIVVDRDAVLIAGEQTTDVAVAIGLDSKPPIVVQTDGTQLVIVQRTDLSMADSPARAHGLALADNRSAQVSIDLSPAVILAYEAEGVPLAGLYSEAERGQLERLAEAEADGYAAVWADALGGLPSGDKAPFQQMTFTLSDAQAATVQTALRRAQQAGPFMATGNENSNGNALARICEAFGG